MRILYVEDEPDHATLMERYIRTTPHHLTIAKNIQEAERSIAHAFDLILLDMVIDGERDGFNLVHKIRRQGYRKPVVAITALTLPPDIQQCINAGCTEVVRKPFTISDLDSLLRRYDH